MAEHPAAEIGDLDTFRALSFQHQKALASRCSSYISMLQFEEGGSRLGRASL